jgi:hypothetical protein
MSLNNIQLKPHLIADLYKDTLIELENTTPTPSVDITTPRRGLPMFLGNNEKKIIIAVSNNFLPFLPDNELAFLTNILSACKLSLADVAIINLHGKDETTCSDFIDQLQAQSVLLFGIEPLTIGLPMNFPLFQLQPFNKRIYLQAPAFSELEKDKGLKMRLWNCLKTLFHL